MDDTLPPPANDNTQDLMMIATALIFDFLKFVFSLFFIFLPIIVCGGVAAWIYSKTGSETAAGLSCVASGFTTAIVEFVSGIGAAAVEAVGEVFADAISFLAWVTFYFWFIFRGMSFLSGKKSTERYLISATGFVLDMVPIVNIAPWTTASVGLMIWRKRKENAAALKAWKKAAALRAANDNTLSDDSDEETKITFARSETLRLQRERQATEQVREDETEAAEEQAVEQESERQRTLEVQYASLGFQNTARVNAEIAAEDKVPNTPRGPLVGVPEYV